MDELDIKPFNIKFDKLINALPTYLIYYLIFFLSITILLSFWIPSNDYDSMSSYIARTKLEEFGNLRETATLELQYVFPKFFDYLHIPFLKLGYFMSFPNLFLFTILLYLIIRFFNTKAAIVSIFFIFG